jgi:mannose-6-phosphate isomerase-like protein (cupin superfamily)
MAQTFDLQSCTLGLHRDGSVSLLPPSSGPPRRIDGFTVGAPMMTQNAPHGGEMHPDADEILYLISGRVDVVLEEEGGESTTEVCAGRALIVPKGVWHRVVLREPSHLLHITPGPGGAWRPPRG